MSLALVMEDGLGLLCSGFYGSWEGHSEALPNLFQIYTPWGLLVEFSEFDQQIIGTHSVHLSSHISNEWNFLQAKISGYIWYVFNNGMGHMQF